MSRMLRRVTTRAAVAGAVVLASLFSAGVVGAAGSPADGFQIEHFANVNTPGVSDDATVRITNPGSPGLRAWGTHVEGPGVITETPFQDATLSSAELSVLADKCGDIHDNGSGQGVCTCGTTDTTEGTTAPQGTLCALIYVFSADQQLAECCGCPVTPNGLLTLSVTTDLTSNPLTGVKPRTGVIKIVSSTPPSTGRCDPTAPTPPTGPTTTMTSTTATSTTTTSSTPTTTTRAASTTTTTTTRAPTTTTTTGSPRGAFLGCQALGGCDRVDCELQVAMADPLCDTGAMSPRLAQVVLRKVSTIRRRLAHAHQNGRSRVCSRVLSRADGVLAGLHQKLARAVKRGRIQASCQAALDQRITGLRATMAALRE